ncbi:GtrA family protein [Halopiger goleimassiliensis]|uniref:GtrA family protein n=1 Tax=Halopiger goleimassiliensis TaxID=1293048 RepID=UPI000677799C|nr:GtrA family protein [Halopiger goleimassiliensis]
MSDLLPEPVRSRLEALYAPIRFGMFAGVGFVGATVDNGVLVALVELGDVPFLPAKVVAWVIAIGVIFGINEAWTFSTYGATSVRGVLARLGRSYLVRFAGFLVTLAIFTALIEFAGVWYLLANVIGIGVGFVVNYTCESLVTWKVHRD